MGQLKSRNLFLGVAFIALAAGGTPALAQATGQQEVVNPDNDVTVAEQTDGPGLETIVVTARRREENLQDTPISVTAFSTVATSSSW